MSFDDGRAERDERQRQTSLAAARQHTDELRHSTQPRWERLRSQLELAGIRLDDAVVASKNTEDHALEFGIVVARDGRAFGFEFDFFCAEERRKLPYEEARVSAWEELDQPSVDLYRRQIETGRKILEEEGGPGG